MQYKIKDQQGLNHMHNERIIQQGKATCDAKIIEGIAKCNPREQKENLSMCQLHAMY